jgi:hypothetical protein
MSRLPLPKTSTLAAPPVEAVAFNRTAVTSAHTAVGDQHGVTRVAGILE